jgi:predicted enzyme related to lactoylglutathione lyase
MAWEEKPMSQQILNVQGVYAAVAVADLAAAIAWYENFVGRPVDDKPIPGMVQWRDIGGAGLQLWEDGERAGKSVMTIVTPNLDTEITRLAANSIEAVNLASGGFGKVAQVFDPDGNRISLAEPPPGFSAGR